MVAGHRALQAEPSCAGPTTPSIRSVTCSLGRNVLSAKPRPQRLERPPGSCAWPAGRLILSSKEALISRLALPSEVIMGVS